MAEYNESMYMTGRAVVSATTRLEMSQDLLVEGNSGFGSRPSLVIPGNLKVLEGTSSFSSWLTRITYGRSSMVGSAVFDVPKGHYEIGLFVNIGYMADTVVQLSTDYVIMPLLEIQSSVEVDKLISIYVIKPSFTILNSVIPRVLLSKNMSSVSIGFEVDVGTLDFSAVPLIDYPDFYNYLLSLLPEIYRENKDCKVFINLMARELGRVKELVSWLPRLKDPIDTPSQFLPYIAEMIGYDFRHDIPEEDSNTILENYLQILRRRGSPRILKAAARFQGHPEDLLLKREVYEDMYISIVSTGLLEILYEDSSISPRYEDVVNYSQAGVKIIFGLVSLAGYLERFTTMDLEKILEYGLSAVLSIRLLHISSEIDLGLSVTRRSKIWGSPLFSTGDVEELSINSYMVKQPDFEIVIEPII